MRLINKFRQQQQVEGQALRLLLFFYTLIAALDEIELPLDYRARGKVNSLLS